ncbi:Oncostatin-M-specific receptor subunit beta [Oryzias melastigma]|uniref:Oncostatin-M-specific receptor subunit beta n=1 Tax=Oryzias melastigma TaxID=30732 RepID=A0A834FM80_ORYME|nr:Oncostatin-M-specific receptor subunit beta [Oryzias melastigma]
MSSRAAQLDSKRGGSLSLLILGLMLIIMFCPPTQASTDSCKKSRKVFVSPQPCRQHHPEGVRDLDCFGRHYELTYNCTWRPGRNATHNTYMLVVAQGNKRNTICQNMTNFHKTFRLYKDSNVSVEIFENPQSDDCTKSVFHGSPKSLLRCDAPINVTFSRSFGELSVVVTWKQEDAKVINKFQIRYKDLDSPSWNQMLVESLSANTWIVKNLNASRVYAVQTRCVTNEKCSQCPWSSVYIVPAELTMQHVLVSINDTDIPEEPGKRLISGAFQQHDCHRLTVVKVSGELPPRDLDTCQADFRLILSYSAYQINISAFNNASISTPVSLVVPERETMHDEDDGRLNVTVHNSTAFSIRWRPDILKMFICYSVEWKGRGQTALHKSFYEDVNNYKTFSPLPEPLEPYRRYSIVLHTRPDKDTCNMKKVNNSESTYGRAYVYLLEGSPVGAPANISSHNVTLNSAEVRWSPIPEEQVRGFLRGYVLHFVYSDQRGVKTETNITVDPDLNSYKLQGLKVDTVYQVQVSGFTSAGAGVRSATIFFKTDHEGYFHSRSFITVLAVVITVAAFGTPILKRAKSIFWPNIPNPGNSSAVQKIEGSCQLELLGILSTLRAEEWDTESLQILENDPLVPACTLATVLPLLGTFELEGDPPDMTSKRSQKDLDGDAGALSPVLEVDSVLEKQRADSLGCTVAFTSDYTTMEMFQQMMPQTSAHEVIPTGMKTKSEEFTVVRTKLDYVRQFSTSSTSDCQQMSTIF